MTTAPVAKRAYKDIESFVALLDRQRRKQHLYPGFNDFWKTAITLKISKIPTEHIEPKDSPRSWQHIESICSTWILIILEIIAVKECCKNRKSLNPGLDAELARDTSTLWRSDWQYHGEYVQFVAGLGWDENFSFVFGKMEFSFCKLFENNFRALLIWFYEKVQKYGYYWSKKANQTQIGP